MDRRGVLGAFLGAALGAGLVPRGIARAEGGAGVLRVLSAGAPNAADSFSPGINRESIQISWNVYDRLVRFAPAPVGEGAGAGIEGFDPARLEGEAAEAFEVERGGRALRFVLRAGAVFHGGRPVTAEDVKFSLDRVLASPIGRAQFATGSMTDPAQFVVEDARTIRIDLPEADRLALPNLALTYPIIVDAEAARAHATADDPFAAEWLRLNVAGGGAYRLEGWEAGVAVRFARFEAWRSGPRPGFEAVEWRRVPEAETRLAALRRGDCDVVQDLAPRDVARVAAEAGLRVAGLPTGSFHLIGMNGAMAPFDDPRVRRAVAAALPYEAMFEAALQRRGLPLWGGSDAAEGTAFPQPMGYRTDPDLARRLLAEAGLGAGFETRFAFDMAQAAVAEPLAVLLAEALGRVGIRVAIDRIPAGQIGGLLQERALPFYFEGSTALLSDPDYFLRVFFTGPTRWNFGAYANPEFEALGARARFEADPDRYAADVAAMIGMVKRDVPVILLWKPFLDVALRADVAGYRLAVHRMLDLRPLRRG
jgi:peptide/nickel transport system substrate-binding protein